MEQRRLRLGDILDDYCPRERRVTNHAVVAMIEDDVKQTRCTTCDAEHAYKGGHGPRKRRKDATSALYREVLAGMGESSEVSTAPPVEPAALVSASAVAGSSATGSENGQAVAAEAAEALPAPSSPEQEEEQPEDAGDDVRGSDDGPFHRRLIRATLPRPEGQKEVRQTPDFTIRANGNRPGGFRGDRMRGHAGGGNGVNAGGRRFGGNTSGSGVGRNSRGGPSPSGRNRQGFGGGGGRGPSSGAGRPQGGRKRSR
jgi:hypothetical protein